MMTKSKTDDAGVRETNLLEKHLLITIYQMLINLKLKWCMVQKVEEKIHQTLNKVRENKTKHNSIEE